MKAQSVKTRKVGNSITITLPRRVLEVFQVVTGQVVEMVPFRDRVIIRREQKKGPKK